MTSNTACSYLTYLSLLTLSDLWSEGMWRWISPVAVVFAEIHPSFMNLNCTYQPVFPVFLIRSSYWHAEESYFGRFNYQAAMIHFNKNVFHCQLQIIWVFLIYFLSNNIISSRDSEIVEYIQNHRNVTNQKSSFQNFFGTCLSDVLMNSLPFKMCF